MKDAIVVKDIFTKDDTIILKKDAAIDNTNIVIRDCEHSRKCHN